MSEPCVGCGHEVVAWDPHDSATTDDLICYYCGLHADSKAADRIRELEALKDRIIDQTTADMCDLQLKLKAAEAEVAAMEREREALNASWHSRCLRTEIRAEAAEGKLKEGHGPIFAWLTEEMNKVKPLESKVEELETKLRAARELPGKWRNGRDYSAAYFADELEALLKGAE